MHPPHANLLCWGRIQPHKRCKRGNLTKYAAILENVVIYKISVIGLYKNISFPFLRLFPAFLFLKMRVPVKANLMNDVVVWDNFSFHLSDLKRQWFPLQEFLTMYSLFLHSAEEFFSSISKPHSCLYWMLWMLILVNNCRAMHHKQQYQAWWEWNIVAKQKGDTGWKEKWHNLLYIV